MLNLSKITKWIKNKKTNGNISILVILILLASSVISLLAINQIQHLMNYGSMTFNYFKSYYLSKAWIELSLTEVYHHKDWFNDEIWTWNFVENFLTWYNWKLDNDNELSGDFSWFEPRFETTISWSFKNLTNDIRKSQDCVGNGIVLQPGTWMTISLFTEEDPERFSSSNDKEFPYFKNLQVSNTNDKELTFGFFSFDKDSNMTDIYVATWTDLQEFLSWKTLWYNSYLTIKNSLNEDVTLCINAKWSLIPSSNFLITSRWYYGDMEVWLQSIVNKQTPSWAMNVLSLWETNI